jgi:hypothetical protein
MGLQPELDTLSPRDELVGHLRVYSVDSLRKDFEATGFRLVEMRGFFLKPLSNQQMLSYTHDLILALNVVAGDLPTEYCANIAFVIEPVRKK